MGNFSRPREHIWRRFRIVKSGGFDDKAYVTFRTQGRTRGFALLHTDLIKSLCSNAKAVSLLFDFKGNYLALRFHENDKDDDTYKLRRISTIKYQFISKIIDKFEETKFFKKDVEIDIKNKLAIIKVKPKEKDSFILNSAEEIVIVKPKEKK